MAHRITFNQVNEAIQKIYPHVILVQGRGYLYITSDDDKTALKIAGMYTTSIPVAKLNHQSIEQWVKDVKDLIENDINETNF
jgi:hypothetical protein